MRSELPLSAMRSSLFPRAQPAVNKLSHMTQAMQLRQMHAFSRPQRKRQRREARSVWKRDLHCVADICIIPIGAPGSGPSVAVHVASCVKLLQDRKLKIVNHAFGTNVEGEMSDVMEALQACHNLLHSQGVPRVSTCFKVGTRTDKTQSMGQKLARLESLIEPEADTPK
eukprot:gb/GEZN01017454.1/.p1 GENE.gb/GEZN01017454.1/~~gb/GEZN01017454.1/.p1  ORF type:complete len:169 (+),score=12.06 gb/GEZN01017454.1/:10-516(+)